MTHEELNTLITQAQEHNKSGNFASSEAITQEILSLENIDACSASLALIILAESLWRRGRILEALPNAEQALSLAKQQQNKELQGKALRNIGLVYYNLSDYPKALEYYAKALTLDEELGNKEGIATVTSNIGIVYQYLSNYPKALEYYSKSLAIAEELGRKDGIAVNLGNIGIVYHNLSDYPEALEYFAKALALCEELGRMFGIATNLGNIGSVYKSLSDYPKALEYYGKALAINQVQGTKEGIAANLGNCGSVYQNLSDYPKALEYYSKALAIHEELGRKLGIAINLSNLGVVYRNLSDYPKALEYYGKALALYEELEINEGIATNLGNIGILYADEKFTGSNFSQAEEYLLKSIALLEKIGAKQNLYANLKSLAEIYEKQKQWEDAFTTHKKYHELYVEVQSEEATKQAQLMEHRRKIEEAERDRQIKLARFQEQEKILHKTLPPIIADRLISGEKDIADRYESVSILFADIVGFTPLSTRKSPREVVHILNNLFSRFDKLTEKYGVERIKTIGDAYMIVAGAPEVVEDHAFRLAQTAFGMLEEIAAFNAESGESINLRIGLNSGEAIAAVVGDVKFSYDLWSDAVNTASRMESHGLSGKIHCTEEFVRAVGDSLFQFTERGEMEVKGKGMMKTYFLEKV